MASLLYRDKAHGFSEAKSMERGFSGSIEAKKMMGRGYPHGGEAKNSYTCGFWRGAILPAPLCNQHPKPLSAPTPPNRAPQLHCPTGSV
jgi:hypothetical protein